MVILNASSSSSYSPLVHSPTSATTLAAASPNDEKQAMVTSHGSVTSSSVSILARQLSEAATRAHTRGDQSNDVLLGPIVSERYLVNKAQHDAEVPDTDTPELLARARQATGFANGSDTNPFKGLARDQLVLIAHDDGGPFTVNERRAAWDELQSIAPSATVIKKSTPASERELMIKRLFGTPHEPPVAKPPHTSENGAQNANLFLNHNDRALFADMYAYAQAEGVDLSYVDRLAGILGTYRHFSDGRQLMDGPSYDAQGYRVIFDFREEDKAIAARILNGSAIKSTRIDPGFLRHILRPEQGAFSNIGGIPFLEKMVNKFSSEGDLQPPLGNEFATFDRNIRIEDYIVRTTDKSDRLPPSQALSGCVNGVWTLTDKGKAEGYTIDPVTGHMSQPAPPPDDQSVQLDATGGEATRHSVLEALADTRGNTATRWTWPGHLFKLMRYFKP